MRIESRIANQLSGINSIGEYRNIKKRNDERKKEEVEEEISKYLKTIVLTLRHYNNSSLFIYNNSHRII